MGKDTKMVCMMNKYQEALNNIKFIITEKEKVDKQLVIVKHRDDGKCYLENALNPIRNGYFSALQELIDNYSKLEKALDNACKILADNYHQLGSPFEDYLPAYVEAKDWKEYLLEESEKE